MLAEKWEKMRSMIERLEGYLERKKLELNGEKTKIIRFRRGGKLIKRNGDGNEER